MANSLQEKLNSGQPCINGWSLLPCAFTLEVLAQGGWDSLTIDMQHGWHDYRSALQCIQAIQGMPVTPLVRVPWNEPGILGKALDGGAKGIICPMVNNGADARALAQACLYPPMGLRSNGPVRGAIYGGPVPFQDIANREVLIFPQIETAEAVRNIDAILSVPGISGIYIGPSDLGLSIGLPATFDREEPAILAFYATLIEATRKRSLVAGIHNHSAAYAARMVKMGFQFVTVGSDSGMLTRSAKNLVSETRSALGPAPSK